MTQEIFSDWDATASNNITVTGDGAAIDINEGCLPGNVNNGMRAIMSAALLSFGAFPSAAARPAYLTAGKVWLNTTAATAPVLTFYDGTDDIVVMTFNYTANTITMGAGVTVPGALGNVVEDTTPQLGGNLDVNGQEINSASNGDVTINPNGTGTIILGAATVTVEDDITHAGDTNNKITFGTDTQAFATGGTSRIDLSDSGLRVGTGARVTTILDEDAMGTDSATALATQQSIKAYVDASAGSLTRGTPIATTSGTTIDFTGIAAGANEVKVMFNEVSGSGTSDLILQGGPSGGLDVTGYLSATDNSGGTQRDTTGFTLTVSTVNTDKWSGAVNLTRVDSNIWAIEGTLGSPVSNTNHISGVMTFTGELSLLTLTTVGGTNTFDNGSINIMYQ